MHWKTTVFLLFLTVGVGAYISLYELRQPDPEERHRLAARVLDVPETVARITLAWPDRPTIILVHSAETWRLEPGNWRTEPSLVQGLLGALRLLYASRSFTPGPSQSLTEFGLEPAAGQITVGETALLIGGLTPVAGGRYVKRTDQVEVHVVDAQAIEAADHPAEDFRDRALLRVEPWEIVHMAWTDDARTVALTREGDAWQVGDPSQPADDKAVLRWLTQWSSLPIAAFLNDAAQPADLASAGIHETAPQLALTLDGSRSLTAAFGTAVPDHPGLRYAARSDEPASLYGVAEIDLEALKKSSEDLRKQEAPATEAAEAADGSPDALQRGGTEEPGS